MKYALLSVTDKTGIESFAKDLVDLGFTLLSTGGTLKAIAEAGVAVTPIDDYTGFPEILDGRVKTLHPKVHGGILYKRDEADHKKVVEELGISDIDLVCVNLYAFEDKYKEGNPEDVMIENIDIGGPSMVRSAAKNFKDVLIVTDPGDYKDLVAQLREGQVDMAYRKTLAMKAFSLTAYYDSMIARYFQDITGKKASTFTLGMKKEGDLRYGENPHQKAALFVDPMSQSYFSNFQQLQGKELSFNNLNDLNTAVSLAAEFDPESEGIVCVGLKHATPCGVALGDTAYQAYTKCYESDPLSIFGGIIALNGVIDKETAEEMSKIFLEVVAARDFTAEALEVFTKKENLRLLKVDYDAQALDMDLKLASGKVLIQDCDQGAEEGFDIATEKKPSSAQMADLVFGMKVVKYVRSNAIVLVKDKTTLGIGGGQTSRIWALENIFSNQKDRDFTGASLASDAFFPFNDCVLAAAEKGIASIIQPGGSIRDQESIDACNEKNISMVFTGVRHFRH